jgi:hypothetical protein
MISMLGVRLVWMIIEVSASCLASSCANCSRTLLMVISVTKHVNNTQILSKTKTYPGASTQKGSAGLGQPPKPAPYESTALFCLLEERGQMPQMCPRDAIVNLLPLELSIEALLPGDIG